MPPVHSANHISRNLFRYVDGLSSYFSPTLSQFLNLVANKKCDKLADISHLIWIQGRGCQEDDASLVDEEMVSGRVTFEYLPVQAELVFFSTVVLNTHMAFTRKDDNQHKNAHTHEGELFF